MTRAPECIFCQIASKEKPTRLLYEDSDCIVFEDIYPKTPVHVLVVPHKHIATLNDGTQEDEALLGHLLLIAARAAKEKGLSGFRAVINTNAEAGQTIFHLHVHVMGGRAMRWPPG